MPGVRTLVHAAAFAIGAIAFAILIERVGWGGIRRAIGSTGWWFVAIAAIDLCSLVSDAAAIHSFVPTPIAFRRVLAAQASGLAINRLTPGSSLGEPIKATLLMADAPETAAIAAIVKFNLATAYVAIACILVGVPLTLATLELPGQLELTVWIATGLLIALALGLALLVRRGALGSVVGAARRLRLVSAARAERWQMQVETIDRDVRGIGGRGVAFVVASRVLFSLGTIGILYAADLPVTAPVAIATVSVGVLIAWMANIVPLGLGLADTGNYALYAALGASPAAGLDFTMVNRTRTCIVAALGLAILLVTVARSRSARSRSRPAAPAS